MRKVYKEDSPKNTLLKINKIFAKLGIVTYESFFGHPCKDIYSCRTELVESLGTFGQNGKGMTPEYALASSHAEFMERLQNGFLFGIRHLCMPFIQEIKREKGFVFYPDERLITLEEFLDLPVEYLQDIFGDVSRHQMESEIKTYFEGARSNGFEGIIAVPFFDIKNRREVFLPYNLTLMITGSNGMSAGNSVNEGVFQALCEILERVAASTIYNKKLTPPTIPDSYLKKKKRLYSIIKVIEKSGYDVIVKDFSVNKRLPVVGTIIIDKKNNKYRLNVGSDTCFDIALSRTLTEIHQGISNDAELKSIMMDIPKKNKDTLEKHDTLVDENLEAFFKDGTGQFPYTLFEKVESYDFDESVFCDCKDYNSGCKYLIGLIESVGSRVFLRDTSFLGFPSFYVYATHVSSFRNRGITNSITKTLDVQSNVDYGMIEKHLCNIKNIFSCEDSMKFFIEKFPADKLKSCDFHVADLLKIEFKKECYWNALPISYFLTIFAFVLRQYDKAIGYLDVYLNTMNIVKSEYYKKVRRYLSYLSKGKNETFIKKNVDISIIKEFTKENIVQSIEFPTCPDCSQCSLSAYCGTRSKLGILSKMQDEMKNHPINQMDFMGNICNFK